MKDKRIEIDPKELAAEFRKQFGEKARENHGIQIVVLDRGFVYVGYVETDKEWVYISQAKGIRVWGTKNGLGQICAGPTKETVLDNAGEVRAPLRALISLLKCDEEKWQSKL